ncbi:MAG TPA: BON domain-containing protein, partial [Gemmataceae bacterium]|nr:BON domain-containing protein [Gemmataceae bacterium]
LVCRVDLMAVLLPVCLMIFLGLQSTNAADIQGERASKLDGSDVNLQPTEEDCQLALFARDRLLGDEVLGPLNLGVTVRAGVATLWGTVPSPALAHRAQERIRTVPGLAQVKNDLRISNLDEDTAEFLKGPVGGKDEVRKINEQQKSIGSFDPSTTTSPSSLARRREMAPLVSRGEEFKRSAAKSSPPLVMPSIPVPAGPTLTVSSFEPAPHWAPRSPLENSVERLRRNNERFQGIRYRVEDGVVHLWGSQATGADIFTFAQMAARLPGAQRVIVEQNR